MATAFLSPVTWDFALDANGDLAMAQPPYAVAQDVASAVRTFLGECWYDTTQGVPYWQQILGESPPLSLVKSLIETQALTVPGVVSAVMFVSSFKGRDFIGQLQVTDSTGATAVLQVGP